MTLSDRLKHFFHVVSNIRPIVWIGIYVAITPVFAIIYCSLPAGQFRIPDGGTTDFGSWLYYSIVTITTLGFGDYTPMGGIAQCVTAVEVMCGLIFLGFFLNAVGSMKSEIDVSSEVEKQKRIKEAADKDILLQLAPSIINSIDIFMAYCYAVTTPLSKRDKNGEAQYNSDFSFRDMADLYQPSGLPIDSTRLPAAGRLMRSASRLSMALDSLQNHLDLRQWPDLLEDAFTFVADYQMFASEDVFASGSSKATKPDTSDNASDEEKISQAIAAYSGDPHDAPALLQPAAELYFFIKKNAGVIINLRNLLLDIRR